MVVALRDWLFVDRRTGRVVIGQTPNATMLLFIAATAARLSGGAHRPGGSGVRWLQGGSITVWAADELLRGVNPFRRIGGALVLAALVSRAGRAGAGRRRG